MSEEDTRRIPKNGLEFSCDYLYHNAKQTHGWPRAGFNLAQSEGNAPAPACTSTVCLECYAIKNFQVKFP